MEEQNPRLTTGLFPDYQRFINGMRSALCSWLLTSGTTPFCPCKPFSCKACPGMEERNKRLTRSLFAVYLRFITGTESALRYRLLTSILTSVCLCKLFSYKASPETVSV